jgi:hypothetical protein|tara:strand:+ start:67586 stop:67852 length:267 start_codon:yes stop_codon:yes gene_type:complete
MTVIKLSEQLLLVLQLIQTKKEHELILSELGINDDWYSSTKEAYFALPEKVIASSGLMKNNRCFNALCKFSIPTKWLSAQTTQYYFSY